MKSAFRKTVVGAGLLLGISAGVQADDDLVQQARQHSKQLAMQLQATLKKSIKSDGPQAAIQVCNTEAPAIAGQLSQGDWQVGRTSLKWRNPDNQPDAWETQVMQQFAERLAAGEAPQTLEASKTDNGEFRYMKAIPTAGVCLACHGEKLAPAIGTTLDKLYPQDRARGFKQGELRGAFTLRKTLK